MCGNAKASWLAAGLQIAKGYCVQVGVHDRCHKRAHLVISIPTDRSHSLDTTVEVAMLALVCFED